MTVAAERARRRSITLASPFVVFFCVTITAVKADSEPMSQQMLLAQRIEARAYEHGEGVAKDSLRAASLYCEGAKNGDAEAQFSLGWMYANGRGVPRNDELAAYFFKLAASQGHEHAARMLMHVGEKLAAMPECMMPKPEPKPETLLVSESVDEPINPAQGKVYDLVRRLSPEYGVSTQLVLAVIKTESNFEPAAVSPKNAQGLMQLIPETSKRFNIKNPFDPEQNIRGGLSYLRWLLAYFEGNVALVAAAYNAGEGAVNRYRGIPPYAETRGYVKKIMGAFKNDDHPYDPNVTAPSPELPRIRSKRGVY